MEDSRHKFEFNGQLIYEWSQSMEEVLIFIKPPKGVSGKMLKCDVKAKNLTVGLKGAKQNFINNEQLFDIIDVDESTWTFDSDSGEMEINLQKMRQGLTWDSVFVGHNKLNDVEKQDVQKKLMLERFQNEHKGFDFSGAEFNGQAPDPRNFLKNLDD